MDNIIQKNFSNLLFLTFNLPVTIIAFFIDYSNEVEKFITTILTLSEFI